MNTTKLNEFDILDLLNEYHSEMRKLRHKAAFVRAKIDELEAELEFIRRNERVDSDKLLGLSEGTTIQTASTTKHSPAKQKRPVTRKKPGRKPQPLSQWDQMIYDSIVENGRAMLSRDILVVLTEKAKALNLYESEAHTRVKLNQCLVKMTSDRRKDLLKLRHAGRGFAYALPQWVDSSGAAYPEFQLISE